MKRVIAFLLPAVFLLGCKKYPVISLNNYQHNKIIAIQPLGEFNNLQLAYIRSAISAVFRAPVIVLPAVSMPPGFKVTGKDQYSADSLINYLLQRTGNNIGDVIGITHDDICTMKTYETQEGNLSSFLHKTGSIIGYGYVSGNSCIVSDYHLLTKDPQLLNNRLRKVILHELGHNFGLGHCASDTCVMFEGDINKLDQETGNYCSKCRRMLVDGLLGKN